MVGAGAPVAVTGKDPVSSIVNVVLDALVIVGDCVVVPKLAVTLCGAFMVTEVEALLGLATLPVQFVKL
jgi:hypothetical protein